MRAGVIAFLLLATSSLACKVPVFRFALERWETDEYTLSYRGDESPPSFEMLVARRDPDLASRYAAFYPDSSGIEAPFWSGDSLDASTDSPLRRQLVDKIVAGASTVWILIEGPDDDVNDETHRRLREFLDAAAESVEIPEGVVRPEQIDTGEVDLAAIDPKDILRSPIPLKIEFQTLRLKRGDASEEFFRRMMLGVHPDLLARNETEPILVPAFGRGRMLEGLPASMLNQETVNMATQYLCGECSCEVKDENPGIDLLLSVDWEALLEGSYTIIDQQLPPLSGTGEFSGEVVQAPPSSPAPARPHSKGTLPRNLFILAVTTVALLTLASMKILRPGA